MNRKIIIESSFNDRQWDPNRLTAEWINRRMKIFMSYTCKSIKRQTNQDFLHLIRYDPDSEELIHEALSCYEKLPENIRFVQRGGEYGKAIKAYIEGSNQYFQIRLDSDNMYQHKFLEHLHQYQPAVDTQILINQGGYIYDAINLRLAHFFHPSPSFYTFIYNIDQYLSGERYAIKTHGDAIKLKHELLPDGNFIVLVHDCNVSNTFNMGTRKGIIDDPSAVKDILNRFIGD